MREFLTNVLALVQKETLIIIKDKRSRIILVMPIILQTLIFGYVASFDLNRVDYVLLDEDHSFASQRLADLFDGSGIFRRVRTLANSGQIAEVIESKKALAAIHIAPHFERALNAGNVAPVQVIVDGRNSNVAGIASSYATKIIDSFNLEQAKKKGILAPGLDMETRAWFNPNLETRWNIISGMIAVLAVIQVMILAGQSLAREKEQGTFDQLLVTPLEPMELMLGKALPPVCVGLVQSSIVLCIALHWFRIPYAGSYLLLYAGLVIFNFAMVGIGLCVSSLSSTMQQAMLYTFSLIMPMILLSGFVTPVSSMPEVLQWATLLNPARYGVEFTQRIYLEGAGIWELGKVLLPLAAIGTATLGGAARLFRGNLG